MKKLILLLILASLIAASCVYPPTQRTYEGGAVGAVVGGIAGALLDRHNPWRGGIVGGALGAVAGATLADISQRASMEAAQQNQPVEYRTEDGRGVYRADPIGYDASTRCTKVQERVWENGRLVKDQIKEVCTSEKTQPGY